MKKQTITRKGSFDSGHRVMNEHRKCYRIHGHTYLYELTFSFNSMEEIGYALDFKEIKRVGCQWIEDHLDHGMILNPHDTILINASKQLNSLMWVMSLNGIGEYCNPTVENIAREIFLAQKYLFANYPSLKVENLRIYETPNCYTDCTDESISTQEENNFASANLDKIIAYRDRMGVVNYDDRKSR